MDCDLGNQGTREGQKKDSMDKRGNQETREGLDGQEKDSMNGLCSREPRDKRRTRWTREGLDEWTVFSGTKGQGKEGPDEWTVEMEMTRSGVEQFQHVKPCLWDHIALHCGDRDDNKEMKGEGKKRRRRRKHIYRGRGKGTDGSLSLPQPPHLPHLWAGVCRGRPTFLPKQHTLC